MDILKRRAVLFRVLGEKLNREHVRSLVRSTNKSLLAFSSDYQSTSYARTAEDRLNNKRRVKVSLSKYIMGSPEGRVWMAEANIPEKQISNISEFVAKRGEAILLREYPENYSEIGLFLGYKLLSGTKIMDVYRDEIGGHSCMTAGKSTHVKLYTLIPQCKIIIVIREGRRIARALLWKTDSGKMFLDRVYPNNGKDSQLLVNYAKIHGWIHRKSDEATSDTVGIIAGGEKISVSFPYSLKLRLTATASRSRYGGRGRRSNSIGFPNVFPYMDSLQYFSINRVAGTATLRNYTGEFASAQLKNHMVGRIETQAFSLCNTSSGHSCECGRSPSNTNIYSMADGRVRYLCPDCSTKIRRCRGCGYYIERVTVPFQMNSDWCPTCKADVNTARTSNKICIGCGAITSNSNAICSNCQTSVAAMDYINTVRTVPTAITPHITTPATTAPKSITGTKTAEKVRILLEAIDRLGNGNLLNHYSIYNVLTETERNVVGLKSTAYVYYYLKLMEANGLITMGSGGCVIRRAA
jgi:hypothetical protein